MAKDMYCSLVSSSSSTIVPLPLWHLLNLDQCRPQKWVTDNKTPLNKTASEQLFVPEHLVRYGVATPLASL